MKTAKRWEIGTKFVAMLALVSLAGCTTYQSVNPIAGQSWQQARTAPYDRRYRAENGRYVVMPGDTISQIAERFGTTSRQIVQLNGLKNADFIYAGQVITVQGARPPSRRTPNIRTASTANTDTPSTSSQTYRVRRGDNLSTIAARHGYTTTQLARANPNVTPSRLRVGSQLRLPTRAPVVREAVPVRSQVAQAAPVRPVSKNEVGTVLTDARPPSLSGYGFVWPVSGPVISPYGRFPNGARNDGINISAPSGSAVHAAENGVVIYAGEEIKALGRMLLVRHEGDYLTTYAHLERFNVKVGQNVQRGQVIGTIGESGRVEQPQLHFQLRVGTEPLDPSRHLIKETKIASR